MLELKKLPVAFYATPGGNEPAREWLLSLDTESRRIVGTDIATAEFGWPVGTNGRIARVIFVIHSGRMVLLHGFVKKTRKTPKPDLALARKRAKEITS